MSFRTWLHRITDPAPRIYEGKRNGIISATDWWDERADLADYFTREWAACSDAEAKAAAELILSGLEERPLNAMERAHAVLEVTDELHRKDAHA